MANYSTLQEAIDAETTNMTILRNNVKNDDDTTSYNIDIDWFKFNNNIVSTIYSSGNSWVGLGNNSENNSIKINRQDTAVYYEYKETGIIAGVRFFKFRWHGYSSYSSTSSNDEQKFEFFLLDNDKKEIYIRYIKKPLNGSNGTYSLVCGGTSVSMSSIKTSMELTLTPSDASAGTGWSVSANARPTLRSYEGTAVYTVTFTSKDKDMIIWDQTTPADTDVKVYYKMSTDEDYTLITNGYILTSLIKNQSYTINIKVEMSAGVTAQAPPTLSNLRILGGEDRKAIYLNLSESVTTPLTNPIDITYDGEGGLQGYGGSVPAYSGQIPTT